MGVVEDVISFIKRAGYSCEHELRQVKDYEVGGWTWTVLTVYVDAGDIAVEMVPKCYYTRERTGID